MSETEQQFSLKNLLVPLTNLKAIHWIIFTGFIVYANMLFNGFVWDDKTYIINNTVLHSVNILNAFRGNLFNTAGQYRPIPVFYFSLLYSVFGTIPYLTSYSFLLTLLNFINICSLFWKYRNNMLLSSGQGISCLGAEITGTEYE